jgi:hypothetical protein
MSAATTTHPAPLSAPASLGPVVRPSFLRLTRVELRKAVDYRAGRWILLVITGLAVLSLGWRTAHANDAPVEFWRILLDALGAAVV